MRASVGMLVFAAISAVAGAAWGQSGPSFSCAKATTAVEKAICGDREASAADRTLAKDYATLLASLINPAARSHLERDQAAWLADRARLCPPASAAQPKRQMATCLTDVMAVRAERLATMPRGDAYPFVGERRLIERGRRGGVTYELSVSYPVFSFLGADSSRANAVIKTWVDDFAADVRPQAQAAPGGSPDIGWFLESGYVVHRAAPDLLTVAAHWLVFTGGAHPNNGRAAWQFEPMTGRPLALGDILDPGSDWPDAVTALVRADMMKQFVERPGFEGSIAPAALHKMVIQPRRWIFAADKVTVTFDPYDVGPYAAGPYEVELSYTALSPYIRKDGPLRTRRR